MRLARLVHDRVVTSVSVVKHGRLLHYLAVLVECSCVLILLFICAHFPLAHIHGALCPYTAAS